MFSWALEAGQPQVEVEHDAGLPGLGGMGDWQTTPACWAQEEG